MTNDQINDLIGVLQAGFKEHNEEMYLIRAELTEISDHLKSLANKGIDNYPQC